MDLQQPANASATTAVTCLLWCAPGALLALPGCIPMRDKALSFSRVVSNYSSE